MTQNQRRGIFVFIFLCGLGYIWRTTQNSDLANQNTKLEIVTPQISSSERATESGTSTTATDDNLSNSKNQESQSEAQVASVQKHIREFPQNIAATYSKELSDNTHGTPPVVLQASAKLFQLAQAVTNEKDATEAMQFFSNCVANSKDPVVAVQTACYRHARTLSEKYPQLKDSFANLQQQADEQVLRIVNMDHQ